VSGSKKPAIDGQLIILAAGNEGLFRECEAAFSAMVSRMGYVSVSNSSSCTTQHVQNVPPCSCMAAGRLAFASSPAV
jgi:3-hydroxyisobutyrate dehydrogenase-like beta-hydroxyacid dehydrogenase